MADPNVAVNAWDATSDGATIQLDDPDNDMPSFVDLFQTRSETVCDFGDVILNVDDGFHPAVKIQVSSCILATASKVLKALFSNRFAEGHAMRAEHQTPSEILIKDTPKDLLLICKLLHWQVDSRPSSHRQLRGFALTVDKYDCVEAMRHISWSLFNPISLDDLSEHEPYDLVTAAYFLDQPESFQKLTHQVVFAYCNTLSNTYDRYTDLLPSNLLSSLKDLQVSAIQELTYGLTSFVGSLTSLVFVKQMPNYACQFLLQLQERGLWPLDLKGSSLKTIVTALPAVHVPVLESDCYPHSPFAGQTAGIDYGSDVVHMSGPVDLDFSRIVRSAHRSYTDQSIPHRPQEQSTQQTLESLAERIRENCAGLCLDCLKGNEQCRLPHPTLWMAQTFVLSQPVTPRSPRRRRRNSFDSIVSWSTGAPGAAW